MGSMIAALRDFGLRAPPGSEEHRYACMLHSCKRLRFRYSVEGFELQKALYHAHSSYLEDGKGIVIVQTPKGDGLIYSLNDTERGVFFPVWNVEHGMIMSYLTERMALNNKKRFDECKPPYV